MRTTIRRLSVLIATAGLCAAPAAAQEQTMAMPNWLAGGWTMQSDKDGWSEEWWTPAKGGLMLGAGRSGKAAKAEWWEQMRIEQADGKVTFCALPKGQAGACFTATKASADEVVFENPTHDFPTRIAYRRAGDQLFAEISGRGGSKPQRWTFKRVH